MLISEKQKGILLGSMLSEISQKEKDKYSMLSLIYEILKSQTQRNKEWQLPGGSGGWEDTGQKVQTFSYKISKFCGYNIQHGYYS